MSRAIPPGQSGKGYSGGPSTRPSTQPKSTRAKVTLAVIVTGVVGVVVAVVASGLGGDLLGVLLAPILGSLGGAIGGLVGGFMAVGRLFSWALIGPVALPGVLGALAGATSVWLMRVFESKNKLGRSFVSSLFSPEIWQGNAMGFLYKLAVGTVVGYAVAAGFSSIGVFDTASAEFGSMGIIAMGGGGAGGAGGGDLFSSITGFFAVLVTLLIAGGIIGACAGGIVGAVIGVGFSSIGTNAVIQGAAEGMAFRIFTSYRPKDLRSGRLSYLLVGAGMGAAESISTGAFVGMVLFVARFIGITA
jgi:hypothetical protein